MSRNDRNMLILGSLGIVLVVVAFYFLLLSPLLARLDEQAQAREDKEAQLAQLQQEVNELEEVRRNSPEIERQLLELNKRIPTQPEVPTLVVQIEEIADAAGVTQVSIEPGPPGPPQGGGEFSVQPITMSFEGTYDQLQEFLLRTRNLARLVTVNSVNYEAAEAEATTAEPTIEQTLQVVIEADVYFQPTGVPSGEAPVAPESTTQSTTGG